MTLSSGLSWPRLCCPLVDSLDMSFGAAYVCWSDLQHLFIQDVAVAGSYSCRIREALFVDACRWRGLCHYECYKCLL